MSSSAEEDLDVCEQTKDEYNEVWRGSLMFCLSCAFFYTFGDRYSYCDETRYRRYIET
jgi:hypothetical protein